MTGRRRLSREWKNLSGFDTAVGAISGWKSSQDCKDGCVPDKVSAPELEVSQEEDHQHREGVQDQVHQQGAEGGGVVAPGGDGGVGGGQEEGAGQDQGQEHHLKEEDGEHRADGGTDAEGVLHVVKEEQQVQGGHVHCQVSSNVTSKKPRPMYFRKKRGIVPDGLVQMRLSNFTKMFPNLQSTWAVTMGVSMTNEKAAACQSKISTNGDTDRKRKWDQDLVGLTEKRRESADK